MQQHLVNRCVLNKYYVTDAITYSVDTEKFAVPRSKTVTVTASWRNTKLSIVQHSDIYQVLNIESLYNIVLTAQILE